MQSSAGATTRAKRPGGQGPKLLRACVVQGGKVIEEKRLDPKSDLTIGTGPKNTFVLADGSLPKSHTLFTAKGSAYELVFTEAMRGKVSADGKPVDFASLKSQGLVKKRGNTYCLPLTDKHRGKVVIGDFHIIFQFVVAPPAPAKPKLPAAARGTLLQQIDWPYAAALMAAFIIELPILIAFQYVEPPEAMSLDTMDERWANLIVPDYKPEEKKPKVKKDKGKKAEKEKKVAKKVEEPEDDPAKAEKKAQRRAQVREKIQSKGILAILGTKGTGGAAGAVADVFGGGIDSDLDSAFQGIAGVGVANAGSGRTTRGGGSGEAASIGGLATSGGGKVGVNKRAERKVGSVKAAAPEVDGDLDPSDITKVVKSRMRSIQDCYEKELKRDPSLSGKIEIEFTIGESGRIEETDVISNGMGSSAVASCITSRIRRWRFPKPNGGSVTVAYPFVFASSG